MPEPTTLLTSINIRQYNDEYYIIVGAGMDRHGLVFKTTDFETFEFVFGTQGVCECEEFSFEFWNNHIYIASRRNVFEQDCYLQKYTIDGVIVESMLTQDNIPQMSGSTPVTMNSRPALFVYNDELYLCTNTINRRDAYFVKVDKYSIKNSYVIVEKNLGYGFNNFSFAVHDNNLLCAATYRQSRSNPQDNTYPLCALANLENLIHFDEEGVKWKFSELLLNI